MTAEEIKKLVNSQNYYNRYEKGKNWDYISVMAGRAMQSAEFNEIQNVLEEKIKSIGNSLYADGTVIEGCSIVYDTENKKINADAGKIFLDGLVYDIEAAVLNMPDNVDVVQVGVWKKSTILTELTDSSLLDPAKSTPQYQMAGAYRVITKAEWGLSSENYNYPFFPVYGVSGGEEVTQLRENINPEYMDALARYDNHSNGHYVVSGLRVTALESTEAGKHMYSISEGEAHINGYEAVISHSVRLIADELPDLADVKSEVHTFGAETGGTATIYASHTPIEQIKQILITKQRTVTLTHGGYTGCTDELPDTSVFEIREVRQGSLYFTEGTDFAFASDRLSWNLPGEEPAPFSTYTVTYYHRVSITPDSSDTEKMIISGAVKDSLVEVDYSYRMPRKDLIVMYTDRSVGVVRGVAHRFAPVVPSTPPEAICLAEVSQTWKGLPEVTNVAIQRVPVETLNSMRAQIQDLYSLMARNEQRFDAMIDAPSSAYGIFVDPLLDDDMRDKGLEQTAVIANQTLMLPLDDSIKDIALDDEITLNFSNEIIINQSTKTKSMKINPYQNFEPMPTQVKLEPAVDRYSETVVKEFRNALIDTHWWESVPESRYTYRGFIKTETTTEITNYNLRQIQISVTASGFGPNEGVKIYFDSIEVACNSTKADNSGNFAGVFTIPKNIPAGTKLVELVGSVESKGYAYFTGINQKTTIIKTHYYRYKDDPLAQTFTLNESRLISGVDFWLKTKGSSDIRIEIRNTSIGYPTTETIASQVIPVASLVAGQWNRVLFSCPVFLMAGTEYAITVMADTSDHEVGIAEIGDWDSENGWVRSQAYSAGVLLSSSNASTWSAHQNADLAFRLLGANFTATKKTVSLGNFNLDGVTDLMPLAEVETTGADTYVTFVLKQNNVEIARMQAWQVISLENSLSGNYTLEAEISGSAKYSPVLGRYPQLFTGKLQTSGSYISRAFACGQGKQIMISTNEFAPYGSSIDVYIQTGGTGENSSDWQIVNYDSNQSVELGSSWVQRKRFVPCNLGSTRIKIELRGTAAARPLVQNISAVVLDA